MLPALLLPCLGLACVTSLAATHGEPDPIGIPFAWDHRSIRIEATTSFDYPRRQLILDSPR